ncbi:hypothetical protein L7F22_060715 [Adiantum nelumboides]|nr:hypothetical protein [Adiantum nelumboides]
MDKACFDAILDGCEGVFHTASPAIMITDNPEEELINPAVKGTLNVLQACAKSRSVKRILLTSSMAAVVSGMSNNHEKPPAVVDESTWSDESHWQEKKFWYGLSKLLAEKAAWCFAYEKGLDPITIVPGMIAGRPLQSNLDTGSKLVMEILTGVTLTCLCSFLKLFYKAKFAKQAWDILVASHYAGHNEAKIALLREELESKIMNEEDYMDTFLAGVKDVNEQLISTREIISDNSLVQTALDALRQILTRLLLKLGDI